MSSRPTSVGRSKRTCSSAATAPTRLPSLQAVIERAASLSAVGPVTDLWPGIDARIAPHRRMLPFRSRAVTSRLVHAAAAGGSWSGLDGVVGRVGVALAVRRPDDVAAAGGSDSSSEPDRLGGRHPGRLDQSALRRRDSRARRSAGRRTLAARSRRPSRFCESNLKSIDQAIEQSRRALEADPANIYLYSHLAEARQRKLALLRRASGLVSPKG